MNMDARAPLVGQGATIHYFSDRHAGTVIDVTFSKSRKTAIVTVQEDTATRVDENGMSDSQRYEYAPNKNGIVHRFKSDKNGIWRALNDAGRMIPGGPRAGFGYRAAYFDFSF